MIYTVFSALIIISIAILRLGVKVFFEKEDSFCYSYIGKRSSYWKNGISCAKPEDLEDRNKKNTFGLTYSENK